MHEHKYMTLKHKHGRTERDIRDQCVPQTEFILTIADITLRSALLTKTLDRELIIE